ncbi:MAG: hypothetical protein NTV05_06365 [Acidobacteria bacterium]|nr:hypothetical protein [Acidobacteriota bacterium]
MKKIPVFFVALALAASVASAQGPTVKTKSTTVKATTHPVSAEVVSSDAAAKTITLKVGDKSVTMPVQGKAIAELASFKAGDRVTATCKDDAKGQHEAITNIKTAKVVTAKTKIKK